MADHPINAAVDTDAQTDTHGHVHRQAQALAHAAAPAFAPLPTPPYYAVVFASTRTAGDDLGYNAMAEHMVALAHGQPGFLGVDSTRGVDGFGITVSYWASLDAIQAWRVHAEHRVARETGRAFWYGHYTLRVAKVERSYEMPRRQADGTAGVDPGV